MIIKKEYQEKSLLLYQGTLTVNLISILKQSHPPACLIMILRRLQKIFKIFIELCQNVSYYSAETFEVNTGIFCGSGWVSVQDLDESYRITTGNVIKPGDADTLNSLLPGN